ncbi:DNA polymerase III subunit alpha [Psychrobacillus lasiicapitis]|uniref:DNA-directed DNA polymerase n=1 Tax=Psychrobacillus lasiicapitis TaxID=1636719 RepID=A0A544T926_9BACI|nr:DNA polymerase III subunit alpha [Psychrobacillus lasiicapitis]TQR13955.1 DNA polymerase III subunit alpha [Psychrobacillus lasiicapitis]GGA36933.1 DNA polymerase III subunit alpha [Psychrobacillus lasiicapitis]
METVYPQIVTSADMLKSTIQLEPLIEKLKSNHAKAVAITNSTLYGIMPFWHAMKNQQIHPVIGLSIHVQLDDKCVPLVLYAENIKGYENLLKISSGLETRELTELPKKWLAAYKDGIIAVYRGDKQFSEEALKELKDLFRDNDLFIGIERINGIKQDFEDEIIKASKQSSANITVYHKSRYLQKEDAFAYEVLNAMDQSLKMSDRNRLKPPEDTYHVLTEKEWAEWFSDVPEWLGNTQAMLERCCVNFDKQSPIMPKFPLPDQQSAKDYLRALCEEGLNLRLGEVTQNYKERLHYELHIINEMNYEDYFLIVQDFIKFAKRVGILTGPGRGSSASSLVAYSLFITDVDPLVYGLLFERFLNPERITMPDIDIDFADSRRMEVIRYVAEKYGKNYVSQIITFGTLSAKSVAREVARIFGFESSTLEAISSFIPNKNGITLKEAYAQSQKLREFIETEEIRKKWFQVALALEGLPRNASTHAAGVVLSPVPLVDVVPIQMGHDDLFLTQWPMKEVEQAGLLKMDFLGLRNLTIIERILKIIHKNNHHSFSLATIPFDDKRTFQLLQNGDTTGVFQLESEGMRQSLKQIQPTKFEDIVAVNALYRPGPMESIPLYAKRKRGQLPVTFEHPVLQPILQETYGIIVYQEQIMQIASQMAGFTFGEADLLRRAVSKKNREVLQKERTHFVQKAILLGHSEQAASSVYDLIVRFADYGFPKSHAVAYSVISYQMAFLKAHFPEAFYCALLSTATGNQDKINKLVMEMKQKGIPILPPSIFNSSTFFTVENDGVRFGLQAIKGVSHAFIQKLLQQRRKGTRKWEDLFDLAADLSAIHFTRKNIEPLIKAGALDHFQEERSTLLATLDAAVKYAELVSPTEETDLFEGNATHFGKSKYIRTDELPLMVKLQFEKEVLGQYFSEHPTVSKKKHMAQQITNIWDVVQASKDWKVTIVGLIQEIKKIRTKKGESMAFVTIQDETGSVSVTLFPEDYAKYNSLLEELAIIVVEGKSERRNGRTQIIGKVVSR